MCQLVQAQALWFEAPREYTAESHAPVELENDPGLQSVHVEAPVGRKGTFTFRSTDLK